MGKGGGGGGAERAPQPKLSAIGKGAQSNLYGAITRGMSGGGMLPGATQRMAQSYRTEGLTDAMGTARGELQSDISRTVDRGDTRVGSAMLNQFDRAGTTAQDSLRRQFDTENYQDQERSMAMATDAVAGEKRMGTSILGMFNSAQAQDARNLQQYGSFGSNLMGGLAEGGMSVAYSNQYANLMSKGA
jgi:hypothetical protein